MNVSWPDLEKVIVTTGEGASVRDVLVMAAAQFGPDWQRRGMSGHPADRLENLTSTELYKPGHDRGENLQGFDELVGVTRLGNLVFMRRGDLGTITIGDLIRGVDQGFMEGDPYRLYLDLSEPSSRGGDGFAEWAAVIEGFVITGKLIGSGIGVGRAVRPIMSAFKTLQLRRSYGDRRALAEAPPEMVFKFLASREKWSDRQLTRLFGACDEVRAAIMTLAGFERDVRNVDVWILSPSQGEVSRLFRKVALTYPDLKEESQIETYREVRQALWRELTGDFAPRDPSPERVRELLIAMLGQDDQGDGPGGVS